MWQLSKRDFSRTTKLLLYKTLILPVLLYGAEAWTLLRTHAAALRIFERKVRRKIFDPMQVGNDFRIRFNSELYELYWYPADAHARPCRSYGGRCFDETDIRRRECPFIRWKDQIQKDLSSIDVTNWRRRARSLRGNSSTSSLISVYTNTSNSFQINY